MMLRPKTRAVLLLVISPGVILLLLGLLWKSLSTTPLRHLDLTLPIYLHTFATLTLTRILLAFTWLGAMRTFLPAVILSIAWLLAQRRQHAALLLGVALTGALIFNEALKLIFHRHRPGLPWSFAGLAAPPEQTFSFPSGHAFFATVLYGMLACLALQHATAALRRLNLITVAIFMPLAIGLSRIYFGMHNPTDVLAGYLAGSLWLVALILADRTLLSRRP